MPQISLTDFIDVVAKSGRPKATKVRQVKERPEYEPAFDFYKPMREHLESLHKRGRPRSELGLILSTLTDPKKLRSYPAVIGGYEKWWGRKKLDWFSPPRGTYSSGGFDIIVNPELGLGFDQSKHVVKLFFKPEELSAFKAEIIVDLMEFQLRSMSDAETYFSVLDIRRGKLFSRGPHVPTSIPIVNAEVAYMASLWNN